MKQTDTNHLPRKARRSGVVFTASAYNKIVSTLRKLPPPIKCHVFVGFPNDRDMGETVVRDIIFDRHAETAEESSVVRDELIPSYENMDI